MFSLLAGIVPAVLAATAGPNRLDGNDQPHYCLGLAFRQQHKLAEARAEFESALRLNPDNSKAHGNLGLIFAEQGILDQAESHFRSALGINPDDSLAQESLDELLKAKSGNK